MKIAFAKPEQPNTGTYVVGVLDDRKLTPAAAGARQEDRRGRDPRDGRKPLQGPQGRSARHRWRPKACRSARVSLAGARQGEQLDALRLQAIGGTLVAQLNRIGESVRAPAGRNAARMRRSQRPRWRRISPMARGCASTASTNTGPAKSRSRSRGSRRLNLLVTDVAAARKALRPDGQGRRARSSYPRPGLRAGQRDLPGDAGRASARRCARSASRSRCSTSKQMHEARHGRAARRRPGQRPPAGSS